MPVLKQMLRQACLQTVYFRLQFAHAGDPLQHEGERAGVEFKVVVQAPRRIRAFRRFRVKGAARFIARGDSVEFD